MNTGDRYYFDFNATAPPCRSVEEYLRAGDLPFANPSSIHTSGKEAGRLIDEARENLYQIFSFTDYKKQFPLFFHSGASEGINTIIKGHAQAIENRGSEKLNFVYLQTDHPCVYQCDNYLRSQGHNVIALPVDRNGDFSDAEAIEKIEQCSGAVLFNYTWVNNETGVVLDLDRAVKIKEQTDCRVHVDAVQAAGKVADWQKLNHNLDGYTFSSHKFGGLKGSGFSLLSRSFPLVPWVRGGGQEGGLRSGTENLLGIVCTSLALDELAREYSFEQQNQAKTFIEDKILQCIEGAGEIVAHGGNRNGNTISLILYKVPSQTSFIAFDMAGIDVSTGSACSSASQIPSRILKSMGRDGLEAKSALRLSYGPYLNQSEAQEFADIIVSVLSKLIQ